MATVHSLNIGIKSNAKQAISELTSLKRTIVGVGAAIGSALAVRQIGRTFLDTAEQIDKMSKASRVLGASLQETMQLDFAGNLSGVEFDVIASSINKMRKGIVAAADKGKLFAGVFDAAKLKAMPLSEQLSIVADKIVATRNVTERAAFAIKIFGKSGAAMIPLLEGGGGAIESLRRQFDFLTGTVSDSMGLAVERMNDDLARLSQQWMSLKIAAVSALTPVVTAIVENVIPAVRAWMDGLAPGGSLAATIFETVAKQIDNVGNSVTNLRIKWLELIMTLQKQFNYSSQLFLGVTKQDVEALKAEIDSLRRGGNPSGGADFLSRFAKRKAEFDAFFDPGSASSSPSRAGLLGAGGGAGGSVAEELKKAMPLQVHLTNESAKTLVDGTVEAADEVNRIQREALLAPERARIAAEQQAAKQDLAEAKKANALLERIQKNTKNSVVLAPAGL